ncbi:MAG: 1-acyl-sn-glycerol-3-phosphate acyltransferase [Leptospiraceae bacterium]|nr:1-acyl-sn-glycerol-3-phosphate acyltransferase [Leptospiraceae bacterium]MCP5502897.1 1-acyl-sn-glycerol-3-phosphate acyltransferase [Leptospiraceae bacterium]
MNQEKELHPGKSQFVSNALYFIGKYLYKPRFKIVYELTEELKTLEGPVLVLSKHSSNHDIPIGYRVLVDAFGRHAWCIIKKSLTHPLFFDFFQKIGGIPIDRDNPEKSKDNLLFARKKMYEGNIMVLFPEQHRFPGTMGEAAVAGFRFITGKPSEALPVVLAGYEYKNNLFRKSVTIRFGKVKYYSKSDAPDLFLYECMQEIARLSGLEYTFPAPVEKKKRAP